MMRPAKPAVDRTAGFTLVEVLVAFAIMALTLVMAMRVLAEGAGWARHGPAQAERVEEAVSVLNQLVADPPASPGETEGVFPDGSRWHARMADVTGLVTPGSKARLMRIELFLGQGGGRPLFVTLAGGSSR